MKQWINVNLHGLEKSLILLSLLILLCAFAMKKHTSYLIAEILRNHQSAPSGVHNSNTDAPELRAQNVGAVSG